LGERFSRFRFIAIFFALAGVIYSLIFYGALPVFALILAISFAFYGYSRKTMQASPIPGLLIETMVLFIPALAYILYRLIFHDSYFIKDLALSLFMIGAGVATTLPLVWFAAAAKRLDLSTIGILRLYRPLHCLFTGCVCL